MPRAYSMTWESTKLRWRKLHRGSLYVVSCRQLGVPPSKEASYQAANRSWAAKRGEIESYRPPHPHTEQLQLLSRRLAWAVVHGEAELAQAARSKIATLEADTDGELLPRRPADLGGLSAMVSPASEGLL